MFSRTNMYTHRWIATPPFDEGRSPPLDVGRRSLADWDPALLQVDSHLSAFWMKNETFENQMPTTVLSIDFRPLFRLVHLILCHLPKKLEIYLCFHAISNYRWYVCLQCVYRKSYHCPERLVKHHILVLMSWTSVTHKSTQNSQTSDISHLLKW